MNAKKTVIILAVAAIVQVLLLLFCDMEIVKDAKKFDRMAYNISKGLGLTEDGEKPSLLYPGAPLVFAPLYYIFGHNPIAVKTFQAVLFLILCVLIYRIGRYCFDENTGFFSAIACALYPPLFILPSILLSEFLFTFDIALLMFFYVISVKNGSYSKYALTGIFCAMASYIRPTGLFVIFFLIAGAFFLLKGKKKFLSFTLISFTAFLIAMLPITARNYMRFGRFTPVAGTEYVNVAGQSEDEAKANEEFLDRQRERQFVLMKGYYGRAGIDISEKEIYRELKGPVGKIIPQDYSWRVKNVFDGIRRLYVSSYSDIYQVGIPLAFFLKDRRLLLAYPGLFAWKLLVLFLSAFVSLMAVVGFLLGLRKIKAFFPVLIILFYNTLFYLTYALLRKTDLTTRYGLPVVPYIILFAVFGCVLIFGRSKDMVHE